MELEDKKLYSYKQALSQPTWVQKFNEEVSLPNPVKFSFLVYAGVIGTLSWVFMMFFLSFLALGFRLMASVALGFWLGSILSELTVDGKAIIFYVIDYLLYYFSFGQHAGKVFINKGQLYRKPQPVKKDRKERQSNVIRD